MQFDWDPEKNRVNKAKHGLSLEEATHVFDDVNACYEAYDFGHSEAEDRFRVFGPVSGRLAVVVFTECESDTVRLISARWAEPKERRAYQAEMERNR